MNWQTPLILASTSPRRRKLLQEAGIDAIVASPTIDDSCLACGNISPKEWVTALAILKAKSTIAVCKGGDGTILAADTVCVVDETILGQPENEPEAKRMIESMVRRDHEVCTGWCLKTLDGGRSLHGCETTVVSIGDIESRDIEEYVESGLWKGKAGGYNLSERCAAGWPLSWQGDPTSVMGLPMERLTKELSRK
ncbi:MAG: nucleoside triphosphate pyrophosphatase [Phycisphaerales bacterium]|nr:nucleoside triphosphate pyrophosphatase [Phycisphaerales bacterium]